MIYKEMLENIRNELCSRRDDLLQELRQLPDGRLLCTDDGKHKRYYQRLKVEGRRKKERRYGIKKKPAVLHGLVRKEYITKALPVLEKNIETIDTALRWFRLSDENSVMENYLKKYPEVREGIYSYKPDLDVWKNAFSQIDGFHPESLRSTDAKGNKMRSDNELYIASRLDHYGLIYRHDCVTGIPGLYKIPDFQIIRPRDLKIIYWEHFGMMDDIEYYIDYKQKMQEYEKHGIVPWDNFITTFGKINSGIDGKMIDSLIQGWLL